MKIGRIREYRNIRFLALRRCHKLPKLAVNAWNVRDDFHNADHGERPLIDDGSYARRLHPRPGATEELGVWVFAFERFYDTRSVEIARGFARRDEDAHKI